MESFKVSYVKNISIARVSNLLCAGFEGGVYYWCQIAGYKAPKKLKYQSDKECVYKYLDYPLNEGGAVIIQTDDEDITYKINLKSIESGLQLMADKYPYHFNNFMDENEDAETGDVFIQVCAFGEIVYG